MAANPLSANTIATKFVTKRKSTIYLRISFFSLLAGRQLYQGIGTSLKKQPDQESDMTWFSAENVVLL